MKSILATIMLVLSVQSAKANVSTEQQQEALKQLEVARAEINTVKSLIPGFLKKSVGKNLQNADERIAYAQKVLADSSVSAKFYCVVESSFDGSFSGKGTSQLEATQNALSACQKGSRDNGFFCNKHATCSKQ